MDAYIVQDVLDGNTEKFSLIVQKYEKMVYNIAYRIFGNMQDCEDITQDTFIKVYKNLDKCKNFESIKTWIYKIAYNTSIDEIRKRNKKNARLLQSSYEENTKYEPKSNEPTPESFLIQKENRFQIEQAINTLDYENRILIYLRDIKGLSYLEISEITEINIGTIKSKISRSRKNLKNILKTMIN